ncbi:TPA: hypothetical protein N0F65_005031, partial [Lagenidium giganteum]
ALRPRAHRGLVLVLDADVIEDCVVLEVLVDSHDADFGTDRQDVGHGHLALDVAARAARSVELAKVLRVEAVDDDLARSVVLDDFVFGMPCAAAANVRDAGGSAAFDGEGVFAHVVPPDVVDGAVVLVAVDALALVLADDGVLERGAGLEKEDGVLWAAFFLSLALDIGSLVRLHAAVEGLTGLDDIRLVVLHQSRAGWPRTAVDVAAGRSGAWSGSSLVLGTQVALTIHGRPLRCSGRCSGEDEDKVRKHGGVCCRLRWWIGWLVVLCVGWKDWK